MIYNITPTIPMKSVNIKDFLMLKIDNRVPENIAPPPAESVKIAKYIH